MNILVANPNTSTGVTDRLVAAGKLVASVGTELLPMIAPRGVPYITTRAEAAGRPHPGGRDDAEGFIRLKLHKATAGTYRRPAAKDSKGYRPRSPT